MGIITGYFCLLCFCILIAKALTHKFHFIKTDKLIMRAHKPVCAVFLTVCILHIILVCPVLKTRHIFVPISGILIVVVFVLVIVLCHMIKAKKLNLTLHRVLSTVMLLKHDNERGALAEKITDKIIAEQQVNVDAISGATNSSIVIKKAIETALK